MGNTESCFNSNLLLGETDSLDLPCTMSAELCFALVECVPTSYDCFLLSRLLFFSVDCFLLGVAVVGDTLPMLAWVVAVVAVSLSIGGDCFSCTQHPPDGCLASLDVCLVSWTFDGCLSMLSLCREQGLEK